MEGNDFRVYFEGTIDGALVRAYDEPYGYMYGAPTATCHVVEINREGGPMITLKELQVTGELSDILIDGRSISKSLKNSQFKEECKKMYKDLLDKIRDHVLGNRGD